LRVPGEAGQGQQLERLAPKRFQLILLTTQQRTDIRCRRQQKDAIHLKKITQAFLQALADGQTVLILISGNRLGKGKALGNTRTQGGLMTQNEITVRGPSLEALTDPKGREPRLRLQGSQPYKGNG
jgi:hypothetical protein